ncbi:hypothetical protein BDQ17DRAFT_1546811 [Cyathus striatus]|nr:hypothetical protein BDQ17DRAFT_1546811 [Cyathus striatus]
MSFINANNFTIENLIQNDYSVPKGGGEKGFALLKNQACLRASHKFSGKYDAPKCHPETRIAVINDIINWARSDNWDQPILWMHGPAGAGKSSIARTVAEKCDDEKILVASFFFSSTDATGGRDDGNRLIPTIAYQMAISIKGTRHPITETLEEDLATFEYSITEQMKMLIVHPLVKPSNNLDVSKIFPKLIIIDGLDECHSPEAQVSIIDTISEALSRHQLRLPLQFFVTSRPELEIRKAFKSEVLQKLSFRLVLDEKYNPDQDIELYIQSEFNTIKRTHTLSHSLMKSPEWPVTADIRSIVMKSSGQLIYASTVMKYIKNDRGNPKERLKAIINMAPALSTSKDTPYAQLAALYILILSRLQDYLLVKLVFEALIFCQCYLDIPAPVSSLSEIGDFLCVEDVELVVLDLHSILHVPDADSFQGVVRFYHASFSDFLTNSSRSRNFFIDEREANSRVAEFCLSRIIKGTEEYTTSYTLLYACMNYFKSVKEAGSQHDLMCLLQDVNPHQITETLARHLAPSKYWLGPVITQTFSKRLHPMPNFIMPKYLYLETIFKSIQEVVNRFAYSDLISELRRDCTGHPYLRRISSLLRQRNIQSTRQSLSWGSVHKGASGNFGLWLRDIWQTMMMENPIQDGWYCFSAEESEYIFRIIWETELPRRSNLGVLKDLEHIFSPIENHVNVKELLYESSDRSDFNYFNYRHWFLSIWQDIMTQSFHGGHILSNNESTAIYSALCGTGIPRNEDLDGVHSHQVRRIRGLWRESAEKLAYCWQHDLSNPDKIEPNLHDFCAEAIQDCILPSSDEDEVFWIPSVLLFLLRRCAFTTEFKSFLRHIYGDLFYSLYCLFQFLDDKYMTSKPYDTLIADISELESLIRNHDIVPTRSKDYYLVMATYDCESYLSGKPAATRKKGDILWTKETITEFMSEVGNGAG